MRNLISNVNYLKAISSRPTQFLRQIFTLLIITSLFAACDQSEKVPENVTFTQHVAPILYNNCTICHREKGPAHFPLVTYQDAKRRAATLAYVSKERLMPPWPADPHYTEFKGQRVMSDRELFPQTGIASRRSEKEWRRLFKTA